MGPPQLHLQCEWIGLTRWCCTQFRQSRQICPERNRGDGTGCVSRIEMRAGRLLTAQRVKAPRGSSHGPLGACTTDQCNPGASRSILLSQGLIGMKAWAWGRERGSFPRRGAASEAAMVPPFHPTPTTGKMGQRADTILTPPQAQSWALPAGWSGVRQATVLPGKLVWLCCFGSDMALDGCEQDRGSRCGSGRGERRKAPTNLGTIACPGRDLLASLPLYH